MISALVIARSSMHTYNIEITLNTILSLRPDGVSKFSASYQEICRGLIATLGYKSLLVFSRLLNTLIDMVVGAQQDEFMNWSLSSIICLTIRYNVLGHGTRTTSCSPD